jgi:molecular chaperone GrpE
MAPSKPGSQDTGALPATLEECSAQLAEARREAADLQDKYLRAAALADNTRKWAERDAQNRAKESQRELLRSLIEVMDNLERALAQVRRPGPLQEGVRLTVRQLEKALAQAGVQRIPVQPGQPFDPVYQEAVEVHGDGVGEDTVSDILNPGYMQDGFVLRPARVIVTR